MILDATASNRTMWRTKNCEHIIYIDVETRLKNKPTIFCDNTKTPFKSQSFDTIFYDPPHLWETDPEPRPVFPREIKEWNKDDPLISYTYFGWNRYHTRGELVTHLHKAAKELYRILKDDGLLWLKWCEVNIQLDNVLGIFGDFAELMRIYSTNPLQTLGESQTYWLILSKIKKEWEQALLA